MSPRLSIGLPVYNGRDYLPESLDSLLSQTYQDYELIISDNASTDGTEDVCRGYAARDARIRYMRQSRNIGAAPNHNVVVTKARGELFKWAAHDDRYDPYLLERCVAALDARPEAVLASCLTEIIDRTGSPIGRTTTLLPRVDATAAAERFRSLLFGQGGDDDYGVIRTTVLRRTALSRSHYHADRTLVAELALHGPFYRVPEVLYRRRDLPGRAGSPQQSIRNWCSVHDPRRANRALHPTVRLLGEYVWALAVAIRRAPLSPTEKRACYRVLGGYLGDRLRLHSLKRATRERVSGIGSQEAPTVDEVSAHGGDR